MKIEDILNTYNLTDTDGLKQKAIDNLRADGVEDLFSCFLKNFMGSKFQRKTAGPQYKRLDLDADNFNFKEGKGNDTAISIRWSDLSGKFNFKNAPNVLYVGFKDKIMEPDDYFVGVKAGLPGKENFIPQKMHGVLWYYYAFNSTHEIESFFTNLGGK